MKTSQQHVPVTFTALNGLFHLHFSVPVCDSPSTNFDMMYTTGNLPNQMGFKLTVIQSLDPETVVITHQKMTGALRMFLIVQKCHK
jgi:hypothetical protein